MMRREGIIDLREPAGKSGDVDRLNDMLQALLGQPVGRLAFSYGDELTLHLGPATPYDHPLMTDKKKGSWILGTQASPWQLVLAGRGLFAAHRKDVVMAREAIEGIEKAAEEFVGARVSHVGAWLSPSQGGPRLGFGLALWFTDGSSLTVWPPTRDAAEPLPDWELLTPYHTIIEAGPGPLWSYERSDVPMNTATE